VCYQGVYCKVFLVLVFVCLVIWNLVDLKMIIEELCCYLCDELVDVFEDVFGFCFKVWFLDEMIDCWGVVYFWELVEVVQ